MAKSHKTPTQQQERKLSVTLFQLMGEEGVIERVLDEPRRLARVRFGDQTVKAIYMNTLTKVRRKTLRKRLRIRSVISVNYHYVTVLCPFNLLIRFKCYNTV